MTEEPKERVAVGSMTILPLRKCWAIWLDFARCHRLARFIAVPAISWFKRQQNRKSSLRRTRPGLCRAILREFEKEIGIKVKPSRQRAVKTVGMANRLLADAVIAVATCSGQRRNAHAPARRPGVFRETNGWARLATAAPVR